MRAIIAKRIRKFSLGIWIKSPPKDKHGNERRTFKNYYRLNKEAYNRGEYKI